MSDPAGWQKALHRIKSEKYFKKDSLDLSGLGLTELPYQLWEQTNLLSLNLSANQLTSLPNSLGQLTNLTSLNLSANQLTSLPDSLGQLTNLSSFSLNQNKLISLPNSLNQLTSLPSIDLRHNQLTYLPDSLGELTNLRSLDLNGNNLTFLPNSLGQLSNLYSLYLDHNQLTCLPNSLGQLTNLRSFGLSSNRLTSLPDSLGQLINLSFLNLSSNRLTSLPKLLSRLANLFFLNLSFNQLTFIPNWLNGLTYLRSLNLEYNQISQLPTWLWTKQTLTKLELKGNPLPIAPELARDTRSILETYFGACTPLHEAKLLLVGEGEVGKTSLIRRLVYRDFNNQQGKTDGIDVHQWLLPMKGHSVVMNIWDFGGQEIYRSTHQFFFTKRSVYMVVISGRQDDSKVLEKWLKMVQQLAGEEAPIVVVVNKIDEHEPQLDERGLALKYPQITNFVYLSCKENYIKINGQKQVGVGALIDLLQETIANLPHVNDLIHDAWWKVKQSLQNTPYDLFSYKEFVELCEKHRVFTEQNQKILAQLLHDLGVVVHFQDDPRLENTHVLNPEWVTKGVYAILNSEKIRQQNGRLRLEDLKEVLDKKSYPSYQQPFLIDLMKKFELCFNLPLHHDTYLIPALFPPKQPLLDWPFHNSLALEYQYEDFLPDTILPWLITQSYEQLDLSRTWRTGFVLQAKEGQEVVNEALVIADETDRKLSIWVKGRESTRRSLLAVLRDRLVAIHGRFQRLPLQEMCPAVSVEGKVVGLIGYKSLLKLEERKRLTNFDPVLDAEIDVRASLNLVEEPEQRVMVELRDFLIERYKVSRQ